MNRLERTTSAKRQLFISHAAKDRDLALLMKKLFTKQLGARIARLRVFCSADFGSIESGKAWFDQIIRALRTSKACVSLFKPHSIYRPWVIFESGGAFLSSRMFPVCAQGIRPSMLPGPLAHLQARDMTDVGQIRQLCREVSEALKCDIATKPPAKEVKLLCSLAQCGSKHWKGVEQALLGHRLDATPFSADELLTTARFHFFCAGQNLRHLTRSPTFKRDLFSWLRGRAKRKAHILICDPSDHGAISCWNSVVGEKYEEDLIESVKAFKRWLLYARANGLGGRLDIRTTNFVPASVTCIDPETREGTLTVTPIIFGKPISGERPHIALSRQDNDRSYNHYWETYRERFTRGSPLET